MATKKNSKMREIIAFLRENKTPLHIAKIAGKLGYSVPIVSILLGELEAQGKISFIKLGNVKVPVLRGGLK